MSQISQKEAVIAEVIAQLPNFQKYVDNAILLLSNAQLEAVKSAVVTGIGVGLIEYSKDKTNSAEVRTYGRSMVMNHLKKAKELNGGHIYKAVSTGVTGDVDETNTSAPQTRTVRSKVKIAPKGVNPDLLPEELKEFVKGLV
jgi:hypothetical protein